MSSTAGFDLRRPAPLAPLSAPAAERSAERIPIPLTSFVGRESEVDVIATTLLRPDVRLLTLTGPGGVGKTRLALRVLPALRDAFPGGVWFVELAAVFDPDRVFSTVAAVMGLPNPGGRTFLDVVAAAVGESSTLITFDNMEHVAGAAPETGELLVRCPELKILTTSRIPLRLRCERLFPVSPLSYAPEPADFGPTPERWDEMHQSDAVTLFAHRARAVRPDFALSEANQMTVGEICRRLDGLPLAIELAAARSRVLSPAAILLRLDRGLSMLTGGPRDLPDRQRTLRDTIVWSYNLLTPPQQALFERLSVFAGGFTVEGAEAIVVAHPGEPPTAGTLSLAPEDVLDYLSDLVDGGLVRQDEQPGGETRFRMLETVREFALERLDARGLGPTLRARHAALFAALVAQANLNDYGAKEPESLALIERDLDNVRASFAWFLRPDAPAGDVEAALRLAAGAERFFLTRGDVAEGRSWIERVLARGDAAAPDARALAHAALGILALVQQEVDTATTAFQRSLALWRGLDRPVQEASTLFFLGLIATRTRDEETLASIIALLEPLSPKIDTTPWRNSIFTLKGHLARMTGDLDAASRLFERSLAGYSDLGFDWGTARLQGILSSIALEQGDLPRSLSLRQASLRLFWNHGDVASVGSVLTDIALLASRLGQPDLAARVLGVAAGIREATGILFNGEIFHDDRALSETSAQLGPDALAAGQAAGRALRTDAGVALALALDPHPTPPVPPPGRSTSHLTPREAEILRVMISGRTTNRDLAEALSISPKTAGHHVDNIMAKLGVNTRVAAVALATRDGLV